MTDHLSDEELSALIDGEADATSLAHVAECPACAARLDGWRVAVARIGGELSVPSVAIPAERRDDAVAAALSAPVGLGSFWSRRPVRVGAGLAAAAAVAAVVLIGVSHLGGPGGAVSSKGVRHGAASTLPAASSGAGSSQLGTAGSAAGPGGGSGPGSAGPSPALRNLGSLSGPSALVVAVREAVPATSSAAAATGGGTEPAAASPAAQAGNCPLGPGAFPPGSHPSLLLVGTAVYRSVPAVVYVYQVGPSRQAFALSESGCGVLVRVDV